VRSGDQYLKRDGARLRYRDSGSGPAVVLIHGWTLDLEMWEPQVVRLADRFRLIRLDRRGHGGSSGIPGVRQDAGDLAALCATLGLTSIALIGMSQGARSALSFAAAAPATVRALVLDGAPALEPGAAQTDIALDELQTLLETQGIEAFRREWRLHAPMQLRTAEPAAHDLLAAMLGRYDGRDLLEPGSAGAGADAGRILGAITAPTLVLNGEFDLATRFAAADYLCRQLPHAQRCAIGAAGHLPNLDNPDAYAHACRAFLSRQLHGSTWT